MVTFSAWTRGIVGSIPTTLIKVMTDKKKTIEYKAGFDCERNGPNVINCNFRLFATLKQTKEWERGNSDAKK